MKPHTPWPHRASYLPILLLALVVVFSVANARAQGTYFLDDTADWSSLNDKSYNNFTISNANSTFEFRFVSDYNATGAIISNSNLQTFINGGSVPTYYAFSHQFGAHTVTLAPGNYSVVMRNDATGTNAARFELDKIIDFSSNSTFYDNFIQGNKYVGKNGGYFTQSFTIQSGFRYWIDGCNTGLEVYIIPASELGNFTANRTFNYFTDYSSASPSPDLPGGYELKLSPGDYYLVARNPAANDKALQYNSSRWRLNGTGGGTGGGGTGGGTSTPTIDLSGSVSWKVSGSSITINAGKVTNKNASGTSGSLRLRVFVTKTRYTGGAISGYVIGSYSLKPLAGNHYYSSIKGKTTYKKPPTGTYYSAVTLEEYNTGGWVIRDYSTFSTKSTF